MYNWKGKSNKEREVLFIQRLLGRGTSTTSLSQYGEFIPVMGRTEPDSKLLYYKDIVESVEITSNLVSDPNITDTESISFTLDDSGYKIISLEEGYAVNNDNTSYIDIDHRVDNSWKLSPIGLTLTSETKYLWNKSTITLSNGSKDSSYKIIASYVESSEDLVVNELTEYYAISPYNTYAPEKTIGPEIGQWSQNTPIGVSIDNRYVWNYNIIKFTDESTQGGYHNAMIIGDYGNQLREVKFTDYNPLGSEYVINNNRITASDTWWNKRGELGYTATWDHVSDITQIQINDVVIIKGIARIKISSEDPQISDTYLECSTLINAKVTQITEMPKMSDEDQEYSIKAITLNYIINDAVAIAGDVIIETTPNSVYMNSSGKIIFPPDGMVIIRIRTSSRVTNLTIDRGWSYYNGVNDWVNIDDSIDKSTISINLNDNTYRTLNPINIKCNHVVYTDDSGMIIDKGDSLSTIIKKEESVTGLSLKCDNTNYEIDPRRNLPENHQYRYINLVNIGVPVIRHGEEKPYGIKLSINEKLVIITDENIDWNTLSGTFTIDIKYFNIKDQDLNKYYMLDDQFTVTVVTPNIIGSDNRYSYEYLPTDEINELIGSEVPQGYTHGIRFKRVKSEEFKGFKKQVVIDGIVVDKDIEVDDTIVLYARTSSYEGDYYLGTVTSIHNIEGDNNYELIIGSNVDIHSIYYFADILFSGIKLTPESRYLGASSATPPQDLLIGFCEMVGDRYFNITEHTVYYYDSSYSWKPYDQSTIDDTIKFKLLEESLYDALSNGSSILGENNNIQYFQALASYDGFIENFMSNYLRVGKLLYSGTKKDLTNISITKIEIDSLGHIVEVKGTEDPKRYDVYYVLTKDGINTYYRYSDKIIDTNLGPQDYGRKYEGYIPVIDSELNKLSKYDFDDNGSLYQGITIDDGYYGNDKGTFLVSDNFILPGVIDSPALKTIIENEVGTTYSSKSDGCDAYYDWNEIYRFLTGAGRSIDNPPYLGRDNGLPNWDGYKIDGNDIVDIAYITNNDPCEYIFQGWASASDYKSDRNTGDYYTKFGGILSIDVSMPSVEEWWIYYHSKLNIYINDHKELENVIDGRRDWYIPRGTKFKIEITGHHHTMGFLCVWHNGHIDISFRPNNYKSGLNFYFDENNTSCINIDYTKGISNYCRDYNLDFNGGLITYNNYTKSQAIDPNPDNHPWVYANSYVHALIPKSINNEYINKVNGFAEYSSDNEQTKISITSTDMNETVWYCNQLDNCSGSSSRLEIYGTPNFVFNTSDFYSDFDIIITTLSQEPSVKVKKLLPIDPYYVTEVNNPNTNGVSYIEHGVDIGDLDSPNIIEICGINSDEYEHVLSVEIETMEGEVTTITIGEPNTLYRYEHKDNDRFYMYLSDIYDAEHASHYSGFLLVCDGYPMNQFKYIYASKVYNAVWNDYVDMLTVNSDLVLTPGKCYVKTGDTYNISTRYCQKGIIGIHSDTYAHSVGNIKNEVQLAISVSGYVLAYIDKRYAPGTPLTSGKGGMLTKMHWWSRLIHPERLVGIYLKDEPNKIWNTMVNVCGRNWIKIK